MQICPLKRPRGKCFNFKIFPILSDYLRRTNLYICLFWSTFLNTFLRYHFCPLYFSILLQHFKAFKVCSFLCRGVHVSVPFLTRNFTKFSLLVRDHFLLKAFFSWISLLFLSLYIYIYTGIYHCIFFLPTASQSMKAADISVLCRLLRRTLIFLYNISLCMQIGDCKLDRPQGFFRWWQFLASRQHSHRRYNVLILEWNILLQKFN